MNLLALRTEILAHGFDPLNFSASRLNQYINDGQYLIFRRVNYWSTETIFPITTSPGVSGYGMLAGLYGAEGPPGTMLSHPQESPVGRIKSVFDPVRNVELEAVQERDIDRSSTSQGQPNFYCIGRGGDLFLYPTPDAVYTLDVRLWLLPPYLVNDTDLPALPEDWHWLLWAYGCWMCYEAEDDPNMGQYWQGRFEKGLAEFTADARFPSSDYPTQLGSIWEQDKTLSNNGWALYWGW